MALDEMLELSYVHFPTIFLLDHDAAAMRHRPSPSIHIQSLLSSETARYFLTILASCSYSLHRCAPPCLSSTPSFPAERSWSVVLLICFVYLRLHQLWSLSSGLTAYARCALDNGPLQTRRYPAFYLFPQYITNFMICFEFMLNCIVSLPDKLTVFAHVAS